MAKRKFISFVGCSQGEVLWIVCIIAEGEVQWAAWNAEVAILNLTLVRNTRIQDVTHSVSLRQPLYGNGMCIAFPAAAMLLLYHSCRYLKISRRLVL